MNLPDSDADYPDWRVVGACANANMNEKNRRNYYRLLHVQPDAPTEVIKSSYRTLMRTLKQHPDLGGDGWNAALINEAYAVLCDPEARKGYDRERAGRKSSERSTDGTPTTPAGSDRQAPAERCICLFCQTDNSRRDQSADKCCCGCGAPLRLVDITADNSTERATGRIEHPVDMSYQVNSLRPVSIPGQVVDLSPTGLRFLSRQQLFPGRVIKIDTPTLSALARVTRSDTQDTTGVFSTGVRFLTLQLRHPRGTFVSEEA